MTDTVRSHVAGVHRDDVQQLQQALAGLTYPAEKWQVLAHVLGAERAEAGAVDLRLIDQLWALPAGRYPGFEHVLAGAARTARGHPRRRTALPHHTLTTR
ncbi:MAG TPA: hypothetical protein VGH99_19480 [Pseudonocardia sp.]|jgi:hypothetical protein